MHSFWPAAEQAFPQIVGAKIEAREDKKNMETVGGVGEKRTAANGQEN